MTAPDGEMVPHSPYPAGRFRGQGIVIPGGGPRYFTCAWVCINVLREVLGCTLPIEVWYLGPGEMSEEMIGLLEPLGVDCIDALATDGAPRVLNGWELKPFAIARSRFKDVLFLDADVVPVVDPTYLFSTPEYLSTGALFWPDTWRFPPDHPVWQMCHVSYSDEPAIDSGMMVIDKERCWEALHLVQHLNDHSEIYYRYMRGDAETFHLAWRMLDVPYAISPYPAEDLRRARATERDPSPTPPRPGGTRSPDCVRPTVAAGTRHPPPVDVRAERDFEGRLLFQHRTGAKWIVGEANARVPGFVHEDACLGFVQRLGARWDGNGPLPPVAPARADEPAEAAIMRTRRFLRCRPGVGARVLELLPEGRIGQGHESLDCGWYVTEEDGRPRLVIEGTVQPDTFGITCALERGDDGIWRGRQLAGDSVRVELLPVGAGPDLPEETVEYLVRLQERERANARLGLGALWTAPDAEALPEEAASSRIYEGLWEGVRSARDGQEGVSLFFALKRLLLFYGNDADYVRARLGIEFPSGVGPLGIVDRALSEEWSPPPLPRFRFRSILRRLRGSSRELIDPERVPGL